MMVRDFQINASGRDHARCPVQDVPVRSDARRGALGFHVAGGKRGLHPRGAAGLKRRRVSAVRRRDSGCRPGHGLHDQEQIAAHARLPGLFPARSRTGGCAGRGAKAAQHQAGGAQARQSRAAQAQEGGEAGKAGRDLTGAAFRIFAERIAAGYAAASAAAR